MTASPINRFRDFVEKQLGMPASDMAVQYYQHILADKRNIRQRQRHRVRTIASWRRERARVRQALLNAVGQLPALDVRVADKGSLRGNGVTIHRLMFTSMANHWVTANLYIPDGLTGPAPALLHLSGHSQTGLPSYLQRCTQLASRGYVVLAFDTLGTGDRQLAPSDVAVYAASTQHNIIGNQMLPAGFNLTWMMVQEAMAAVTVLQRRPEVDGDRIGALGSSGGGMLTIFAGALDERVRVLAPAAAVHSEGADSVPADAEQAIHNIVGAGIDYPDLLGFLIAPRPVLITANRHDIWSIDSTRYARVEAMRLYQLHSCASRLRLKEWDKGHAFDGDQVATTMDWFDRWLKPARLVVSRRKQVSRRIRPRDLKLSRTDSIYADGYPSVATTFRRFLDSCPQPRRRLPAFVVEIRRATRRTGRVKAELLDLFSFGGHPGQRLALSHEPGLWLPLDIVMPPQSRRITILADPINLPHNLDEIGRIVAAKHALIVPSLRGWGATQPAESWADWEGWSRNVYDGRDRDLFSLAQLGGRDLVIDRARDLGAAIDLARKLMPAAPIELVGRGQGALIALLAALADPRIARVHVSGDLRPFRDLLDQDLPVLDTSSGIFNLRQWGIDIPDMVKAMGRRAVVASTKSQW